MPIFSPLNSFPLNGQPRRLGVVSALFALALALGGCATVPPPDNSMNQAQLQLQMAQQAGAGDYAPVDLGFAQDKFQMAQAAMADRKYADARTLAEESMADAELAQAKAKLGAARARIQQRLQENTRLREIGERADAAAAEQFRQMAPVEPMQDHYPTESMPAPPASELSEPLPGEGFQTLPQHQPSHPPAADQEVQP